MNSLINYKKEELEEHITPKFRVKQIYDWVYKKYQFSFDLMKNLPKDLKEDLSKNFSVLDLEIANKQISQDGSIKYLFTLKDAHTVEAVLLKMKGDEFDTSGKLIKEAKYTVCLSTQVGCKVGCSFCLTGKSGFIRDLEPAEIVAQMLLIKADNNFSVEKGVNIVYMGMGEPLDNLENVVKAIEIFAQKDGMAISTKRQTISTSGISSKIDKLGKLDLGVQLAISLHAVDNQTRDTLIPMNKAFPIETILDSVRAFPIDTRKRVMFEYIMIKDINDKLEHAKKLNKLLQGIKSKVNLIYFNPYENTEFSRPTQASMEAFKEYLNSKGVTCTIRESKGLDISAACGQLKEQKKSVSHETFKTEEEL